MSTLTLVFSMMFLTCAVCALAEDAPRPVRVLVWDERQPEQQQAYDGGYLGDAIAAHLAKLPGLSVKSVGMDAPEQGLDAATLDATDVLVWWGHKKHAAVDGAHEDAVVQRVLDGKLALIALHSAHWSKPFVQLMNARAKADALLKIPEAERAGVKFELVSASGAPKPETPLTPFLEKTGEKWTLHLPMCVFPSWRADGKPSHVRTLLPEHPLAAGLPAEWTVFKTEMYNEPFHVPKADAVVFEEKWDAGEHFFSGSVWTVGKGRVVYFRPGHETFPVYKQAEPLKVLENAVRWCGAELRK